jgi:hypothetical protein
MATLKDHIETIDRYVQHGCEPGSCTKAILENNLMNAVANADEFSQIILADIVKYVYSHVPLDAWGSKATVEAWMKKKREETTTGNIQAIQ